MSVQVGIWNLDGQPVNQAFLAQVRQSLLEYGPDGEKVYLNGSIGMLYRPFCTTAESYLERQPYHSATGEVMMWDGRLDNRDELIPQLQSAIADDATDVAIVAAAFDRWSTGCFAKLIGDWAISVWSPRERRLILARDYIGVKQLFFYRNNNRIIWCNHLAPLALCGDQFTLCEEYIAGYLAADPSAHLTPYEEIRSIPPGTFVRLHDQSTVTQAYWVFNVTSRIRYRTDAEYDEQYRYLFRQAVRRRLRAPSPVLAELSGGLDSSSIVCMADHILVSGEAGTPRLDTFSYHDSNEAVDDDLSYSMKIEDHRGKTGFHVDLKASGESFCFNSQCFVARPGFGAREEVNRALYDLLQEHKYRVVLSGRGGDELNGQTLTPQVQMADLLADLRFLKLSKHLTEWSLLIRKRPWIHLFFQTLLEILRGSLQSGLPMQLKSAPWISSTLAPKCRQSVRQTIPTTRRWFLRPSTHDAVQTISILARRISTVAPSVVEVRYPYLDQHLAEFLMTIPVEQLLKPGQRRFLMRRALTGIIPKDVIDRKTKAAASRCYPITLRRHWDDVERAFSSSLCSQLGYVHKEAVLEALGALKAGRSFRNALQLLRVLSLELWLKEAQARGVISIDRFFFAKIRQAHGGVGVVALRR